MTPAAIRAATRVPEYSVTCDVCQGKMFRDGKLCAKCDGEGRFVIADRRLRPPITENGKLAIILAMAIGFGVVMVLAILM